MIRERKEEEEKKERGKGVPRTRMESIRGGKCVPLVPHACFSAWGGQTREFPRGWIKAAAPVSSSGPTLEATRVRLCVRAHIREIR